MGGDGFTTDAQVLPTLAAVIKEQAQVLGAAIAPFREAAIDGMAEAWGSQGKEARQEYLDGVAGVPEQMRQLVAMLQAMADKLLETARATAENEQATAEMFGSLFDNLSESDS